MSRTETRKSHGGAAVLAKTLVKPNRGVGEVDGKGRGGKIKYLRSQTQKTYHLVQPERQGTGNQKTKTGLGPPALIRVKKTDPLSYHQWWGAPERHSCLLSHQRAKVEEQI